MTNEELYKDLQKVSSKITERKLRLVGHCLRHPGEISSNLVLWHIKSGRKTTTFADVRKTNTKLDDIQEIKVASMDKWIWTAFVMSVQARVVVVNSS